MVRPLAKAAELEPRREANPRYRQILQELALKIFEGEWKTGDQLPPERELALKLGVSRATLREALKQLIGYGLLSARQGLGTVVLDWRRDGGLELLPLFLEAGAPGLEVPRLLPTALRLRRVLVEEIVRWLASRKDQRWVPALRGALQEAWEARRDPQAFILKDFQFIRLLCSESGFFPALWILNELQGIYLHFLGALPSPPPVPEEYESSWSEVLHHCGKGEKEAAVSKISRYFSLLDRRLLRLWGLE